MKLKDLGELSPAEKRVIDAHRVGQVAVLGDAVPKKRSSDYSIRADFIRYLALGGCKACKINAKGVQIIGAWIDGFLDLENENCPVDLSLQHCNMANGLTINDAKFRGLYLTGSYTGPIEGQRVLVKKSLHLCEGFHANGAVRFRGAQILGQLNCRNGYFENQDGLALDCAATTFNNSVFLDAGFVAKGKVSFLRTRIKGQLACVAGSFENPNNLALDCEAATIEANVFLCRGMKVDGDLCFTGAKVSGSILLNDATIDGTVKLDTVKIEASLEYQRVDGTRSMLDLANADIGVFKDDLQSWNTTEKLDFTHFRYDRLDSRISVRERLELLGRSVKPKASNPTAYKCLQTWEKLKAKATPSIKYNLVPDFPTFQHPDCEDPLPQPYVQLAKVLRDSGQRAQAAQVLVTKERIQRRAEYRMGLVAIDGTWTAGAQSLWLTLRRPMDFLFGLLFGYGHAPQRALIASLLIVVLAWVLYGQVWFAGEFAPNSAVILASDAWLGTFPPGWSGFEPGQAKDQLAAWTVTPAGQDYETFKPWLYAIDLFVPLDALGQENAWRASYERGWWGKVGYYARFPIQLMGWVITAIGAAVLTGLVGRRD